MSAQGPYCKRDTLLSLVWNDMEQHLTSQSLKISATFCYTFKVDMIPIIHGYLHDCSCLR